VLSNLENVIGRNPLLKGEGGPKGRVRGAEILLFTPHPPLRGTLSFQERDSPDNISHCGQHKLFIARIIRDTRGRNFT
jgi:hypothetical protein